MINDLFRGFNPSQRNLPILLRLITIYVEIRIIKIYHTMLNNFFLLLLDERNRNIKIFGSFRPRLVELSVAIKSLPVFLIIALITFESRLSAPWSSFLSLSFSDSEFFSIVFGFVILRIKITI